MKKIGNLRILDYVRTSDGELAQVKKLDNSYVYTDVGRFSLNSIVDFNNVLSYLLQSGDFINGARVYAPKDYGELCINGHSIHSTKIMQVMTKEKFYRNCYSPNSVKAELDWRVIKDFPNYQVSNTGLVMVTKTGKYMSYLQDRETLSVRLESIDGRRLRKSVAVLVLEAFVENAEGRLPKFKNGDNQDCTLENLEWETKSEQAIRVLPKKKQTNRNYKYKYIVGYYEGLPVVYALNTRELQDYVKMNCDGFTKMSSNHFTRSILTGVPYHGILYKCVSEDDYNTIIQNVNIKRFPELCRKISHTESQVVSTKKARIKEVDIKEVKKENRLDTIDDSGFFKEQERLKKQKFLDEMKKRLNI